MHWAVWCATPQNDVRAWQRGLCCETYSFVVPLAAASRLLRNIPCVHNSHLLVYRCIISYHGIALCTVRLQLWKRNEILQSLLKNHYRRVNRECNHKPAPVRITGNELCPSFTLLFPTRCSTSNTRDSSSHISNTRWETEGAFSNSFKTWNRIASVYSPKKCVSLYILHSEMRNIP